MRILIVRPTPNKMNLKIYNLQEIGLAKALIRKGHICDVMYYCEKEKDHTEIVQFDSDRSLQILWLHGYGLAREGIYPSLKKHVNNYDIIQVGGYVGLTSCWLNREYQDKVVNYQGPYFYEGNWGDIKKAAVFDKVILPLQHKENMIVVTKSVLATEYVKSKGISAVTTIGVGLDLDNLIRDSEDIYDHEFIQTLVKKHKGEKYLLYIGVLEDRRNILFMLEVFSRVNKAIPNTKLVIIGKGQDEYVKMCFAKMDTFGIKDKVIYKESLEQKYMPAVYKMCDAFLLPTKYEIFGMVLLEAMYFGLPVFTTYNGGSSTLMHDENGVVIREMDMELWSEKIRALLMDDEERERMGAAAHRTVAEGYTWDALADKFLEVYKKRINN